MENEVEKKLRNAPAMEARDENAWREFLNQHKSDYGRIVDRYAERWARLMQLEISSGKKLEEVAFAAHSEADLGGITHNVYDMAVSILVKYWKYGEQLRRWHNLRILPGQEGEKVNEEGGILSSAVLPPSIM